MSRRDLEEALSPGMDLGIFSNPLNQPDQVVRPRVAEPEEPKMVRRIETNLKRHDIDLHGLGPIQIERDENNLILKIAGRKVVRNKEGFIERLV